MNRRFSQRLRALGCFQFLIGAGLLMVFGGQRVAAQSSVAGRLSALFAGHASYIDNAEPEPFGQLDVEQDLTYSQNRQVHYSEFPLSLTYGLLPRWDVSAAAGGVWESYHSDAGERVSAFGFGDLLLNTKLKLLDEKRFWASQSVELGVKAPTADARRGLGTGSPDYDLTWILSKNLSDRFTVDANFGYTWLGNDRDLPLSNQFHYGLATEYQASDKLGLFAQLLSATPANHPQSAQFATTVGIGWWLTPEFSAHAALTKGVGHSLIGYVCTVGVTWSFRPAPRPAGRVAND